MKRLTGLLKRLRATFGPAPAPPARDIYRLLLWEQVTYVADDAKHLIAWRLLESSVGTRPEQILGASDAALRKVTRAGGAIAFAERAERLRFVARRVAGEWDGHLDTALKPSLDAARRELMKYPTIAEAGAERLLMIAGWYPVLGLDSNAVRVLVRLGYGTEHRDWKSTYRSVRDAAAAELAPRADRRREAYLMLRHHGQTVCRRSWPKCGECPIADDCPSARAWRGRTDIGRHSSTPGAA